MSGDGLVESDHVSLLGEILDPLNEGVVRKNRVYQLLNLPQSPEKKRGSVEEEYALVVSDRSGRWNSTPPNRLPPRAPQLMLEGGDATTRMGNSSTKTGNASTSSTAMVGMNSSTSSTAMVVVQQGSQLEALNMSLDRARDVGDSDLIALLQTLSWRSRQLNTPNRIKLVSLRKFTKPVPRSMVQFDDSWRNLGLALMEVDSDDRRGWAVAAMLAVHCQGEFSMRASLEFDVPDELIPGNIAGAWCNSPRLFRHTILNSTKTDSPHSMFEGISKVHLPLLAAALKVVSDSSARKAASQYLSEGVLEAWTESKENERAAALSFFLRINFWDDDFVDTLRVRELSSILFGHHYEQFLSLSDEGNTTAVSGIHFNAPSPVKTEKQLREHSDHLQALRELQAKLERAGEKAKQPLYNLEQSRVQSPAVMLDDDVAVLVKRVVGLRAQAFL